MAAFLSHAANLDEATYQNRRGHGCCRNLFLFTTVTWDDLSGGFASSWYRNLVDVPLQFSLLPPSGGHVGLNLYSVPNFVRSKIPVVFNC